MRTIRERTGTGRSEGMFGVEIEVESPQDLSRLDMSDTVWQYTHDDSLRGEYSGEYVFSTPQNIRSAKANLNKFYNIFEESGVEILDSGRAGTHVHINMKDLTMHQVCSFAMYWYMVEDLLIKWNGPSRENNMFSVPVSLSPQVLEIIPKLCEIRPNLNLVGYLRDHFSADYYKYSSLNWCRLWDLNTLETRIWNPSEKDKVYKGLDILKNIYELAKSEENISDISEKYSLSGPMDFAKSILGNHLETIMKDTNTDEESLKKKLRDSFWNLQICIRSCKPVEKKISGVSTDKGYIDEGIALNWMVQDVLAVQRMRR